MTEEQSSFLDTLVKEQQKRMAWLTARRVGDEELASDIVQETLLTACWKIDEVYRHENPTGWLYKVLDYLTKREMHKAYHKAEMPLMEDIPIGNNTTDLPMENYLPRGLTEHERTLLLWRIKEGRTYDEMAEKLGITPAACRKQMSRTFEKCRQLMREDFTENFFR